MNSNLKHYASKRPISHPFTRFIPFTLDSKVWIYHPNVAIHHQSKMDPSYIEELSEHTLIEQENDLSTNEALKSNCWVNIADLTKAILFSRA